MIVLLQAQLRWISQGKRHACFRPFPHQTADPELCLLCKLLCLKRMAVLIVGANLLSTAHIHGGGWGG